MSKSESVHLTRLIDQLHIAGHSITQQGDDRFKDLEVLMQRLGDYLLRDGVQECELKALVILADAFSDSSDGRPSKLFRQDVREERGRPLLSTTRAKQLGLAAAAISLSNKSEMRKIAKEAAVRLRVEEKYLWNFRRNLLNENLRSHVAYDSFDYGIGIGSVDEILSNLIDLTNL